MKVGKVVLYLGVSGIFLIVAALYGCQTAKLTGMEEYRLDLQCTPAVSLHEKTGVLRRKRVLKPMLSPEVLVRKEIIEMISKIGENDYRE